MRRYRISLYVVVILLLAGSAFAQATSSLRGKVTDAKGAPIPGVAVQLVNDQTGFKREVFSDETSAYQFAQVPPGAYAEVRLVDAVQRQHKAAVRALLKQKADVNLPQADGATALAWAAHWDDVETAMLLVKAGANVNAANELGVTPLMLAATNGSAAMVDLLLKAGARASAARSSGETPLMFAARTGIIDVIKLLLAHGADPNARTSRGQTALMWAAAEKHADVAKLLIDNTADISARTEIKRSGGAIRGLPRIMKVRTKTEARNPQYLNPQFTARDGDGDPPRVEGGFTPLLYVALSGDIATAQVLIAGGANVNDQSPDGVTSLMVALNRRHEALALFFLENGADPNAAGAGYTALHLAAATGQIAALRSILTRGGNPNAPMDRPKAFIEAFEVGNSTSPGSGWLKQAGSTPFLVAAWVADAATMRALADGGADPKLTTKDGTTAVMLAAGLGKRNEGDVTYYDWTEENAIDALKVGLDLGIDINAQNDSGETALHAAAYHAANKAIEFLVSKGASLNLKDFEDQTPLRVARGHLICCTTFVTHPPTAELLRKLGADTSAGTQLTFGLSEFVADTDKDKPNADAKRPQ